MQIEFSADGGIAYMPALAAAVTIDTAALAPEQAAAMERLVEQADFFNLPEQVGQPPAGAADYQTCTITVRDQSRSHTVHVAAIADRPEVAALVRALRKQVKESRRTK